MYSKMMVESLQLNTEVRNKFLSTDRWTETDEDNAGMYTYDASGQGQFASEMIHTQDAQFELEYECRNGNLTSSENQGFASS